MQSPLDPEYVARMLEILPEAGQLEFLQWCQNEILERTNPFLHVLQRWQVMRSYACPHAERALYVCQVMYTMRVTIVGPLISLSMAEMVATYIREKLTDLYDRYGERP